jgi:glutamate carboxypeptidase
MSHSAASMGAKIILYRETIKRMSPNKHKSKRGAETRPDPFMMRVLEFFEHRRDGIAETVRELVEIESPSDNKTACDRIGQVLADRFGKLGGKITRHQRPQVGDHLQATFEGENSGNPILLLGHMDTVYPMGTLSTTPCRIADGKLYGPGSFDMKSGIALIIHAIEALIAIEGRLPGDINVLLVSDEEIGSGSSRKITESLAQRSRAVLVLEPAAGAQGSVKTARKGVGEYTVRVTGVSAHAGLDPGKGHSAIVELARQIERISKLNDLARGLSVNVGVIRGGTRSNVVPAEAIADIDVRIARASDASAIDRKLRSLKVINRYCRLEVSGGINRLPMERTEGVAALYNKAQAVANNMGWQLGEAAVGGGSDGNFTAGMGIPTLDGLGGVGEGAHAVHESIVIDELPRRAALLTGLLKALS